MSQDEALQKLIDEWFWHEFIREWPVMASACFIAAHNYYLWTFVKSKGESE